jgi:O-antigen ligase
VTAVVPRDLQRRTFDGQGDELGAIATFGARVFIFFAFIYGFLVTGYELLPGPTPLVLLVGAFGVLVLAPQLVVRRIPVSLLVLSMIGLMVASVLWTDNPPATAFALQQQVPLLVGMCLIAGMISLGDLVSPLLWAIRFAVLFSGVTVALFPEARIHINPEDPTDTLAGWHGFFPHKNTMTPFLVFGALTVLTFDRRWSTKLVTLAGIGVLMVGSDSMTGISSLFLAVSAWVWLQLYRNLDLRNSSVFLVSSLSLALFAVLGAVASLATITSASGKDLTFTGRTFIWSAVWEAITERPVLGWGLGGILSADPVTPRTAAAWRAIGFEVPHAHSGTLDLALQLGLVGLTLFALIYGSTLIDAVSMLRTRPSVAAWILSTMLVQFYMSLSEPVFLGNGWFLVLVLFRVLLFRRHGMKLVHEPDLVHQIQALPGSRTRPRTRRAAASLS